MRDRIKPKIKLDDEVTIRTFMMGTIDLIEQYFGDLWGDSIEDDDELTDEQEEFYEKFSEIRERILDIGNDLIRKNRRKPIRRKIYG